MTENMQTLEECSVAPLKFNYAHSTNDSTVHFECAYCDSSLFVDSQYLIRIFQHHKPPSSTSMVVTFAQKLCTRSTTQNRHIPCPQFWARRACSFGRRNSAEKCVCACIVMSDLLSVGSLLFVEWCESTATKQHTTRSNTYKESARTTTTVAWNFGCFCPELRVVYVNEHTPFARVCSRPHSFMAHNYMRFDQYTINSRACAECTSGNKIRHTFSELGVF